MRKAISIFLLIVLMLHCFSQLGVYLSYQLNREYIAKTLCENRDKPRLHCNGKCHLRKQLRKAAESEKKTTHNSENRLEINWFCTNTFQLEPQRPVVFLQHTSRYLSGEGCYAPSDFFHPPSFPA